MAFKDFCTKCGKRLVWEGRPAGYDPNTGEAIYTLHAECPNNRWWNKHTVLDPHHITINLFGEKKVIFSLTLKELEIQLKTLNNPEGY